MTALPSQINYVNVYGPGLVGMTLQGIETGIIICQAYHFWGKPSRKPMWVKLLAAFVSIIGVYVACTWIAACLRWLYLTFVYKVSDHCSLLFLLDSVHLRLRAMGT